MSYVLRTILTALVIAFMAGFAHAAAPPDGDTPQTESIVATGYGRDAAEARENALKLAVESVVGSLISADTVVENRELLEDRVLSFSAGYVTEHTVLETEQTPDGMVKVSIEAEVARDRVARKLDELNVTRVPLAGEALFGEALTRHESQLGAVEIFEPLWEGIPGASHVATLTEEPEIIATDHATGEARVRFQIEVSLDDAWLDAVLDAARTTAREHDTDDDEEALIEGLSLDTAQQGLGLLAVVEADDQQYSPVARGRNVSEWFLVDKYIIASLLEALDPVAVAQERRFDESAFVGATPNAVKGAAVRIELKDGEETRWADTFGLPERFDHPAMPTGPDNIPPYSCSFDTACAVLNRTGLAVEVPSRFIREEPSPFEDPDYERMRVGVILRDHVANMTVEAGIDPEILRDTTAVELTVTRDRGAPW